MLISFIRLASSNAMAQEPTEFIGYILGRAKIMAHRHHEHDNFGHETMLSVDMSLVAPVEHREHDGANDHAKENAMAKH